MIKVLGSIPKKIAIAVSGGPDSMAAIDFLSNHTRRDITALHFNHGTAHAKDAEEFVREFCLERGVPLVVGRVQRPIEARESREAYWRSERYGWFEEWHHGEYISPIPIITCHHLDDAVETWIFTSLHGNSMLIPYKRDNFIRPFLSTRKDTLVDWCDKKNVPYIVDPSNDDTSYMRNYIRHTLLPNALNVNPGLHKVVKKKVLEQYNKTVAVI
jgi:tRNA(Ile)-lysidine synthase